MNSAGKCRNARLNQARRHAEKLLDRLIALSRSPHTDYVDEPIEWSEAREALDKLGQCFHEANAYNNVMGNKS